jgi:hypothetical protein
MFIYKVVDAPRIERAVSSENTDPADRINPAQSKHLV